MTALTKATKEPGRGGGVGDLLRAIVGVGERRCGRVGVGIRQMLFTLQTSPEQQRFNEEHDCPPTLQALRVGVGKDWALDLSE